MALDVCERARRRAHRSAAARGRGSPALALDGAPGHHFDHGLGQLAARALAHVTMGSGGRSGLTSGRHRKGRRGYSGELGETVLCAKQREIGRGFLLTACRGRRRAHRRRGGGSEGARRRRRLGRRSGELGARLPRASGTRTCNNTRSLSSWRSQKSKRTGGGSNPSPAATDRRRRREPEAAARGNWCSSACASVLQRQREAQGLVCELK
jgi:hypothetical protein